MVSASSWDDAESKRECDGWTQTGRPNRSRPRDCRAARRSHPFVLKTVEIDRMVRRQVVFLQAEKPLKMWCE